MFLVIDWVWQFLLQEDKQRMCVFAIDCDFTEQIDLGHEPVPRPYILQGIENLTVIAVLLVTELIAGKTQNSEPLLTVLIHKLVHLGVIPDSCTSERGHIFNQHHFPFVL